MIDEQLQLLPNEPDLDEGATGLESEDTGGSATEISEPFDPSQIRVDTRTPTISLLLSRIEQREIDLAPGFQRKAGIWSIGAQSRLIESLLIRIPLPAFYMDGTDEDRWLVVDGLQRLTTIKRFVSDRSLELEGLEFLKQYRGAKYDALPRSLQRRILETQVTVFVIQEKTPPEVKFNIFKRINTGGLPLSSQEIRHALNQGPAAELLGRLAGSLEFRKATANGIRDDRMGDRECVLRFLAFAIHPFAEYISTELDSFLNNCMAEINRMAETKLAELEQSFLRSMRAAYAIFGNRAFRKQYPSSDRRFPINRALFETWAVTLAGLSDGDLTTAEQRAPNMQEAFRTLMLDSDFDRSISQGTGDIGKVRYRFSEIAKITRNTIT